MNLPLGEAGKPLSFSEIISRGWLLYRNNFSQYCLISLRANAWLALPVTAALAVLLMFIRTERLPGDMAGILALLASAWAVLLVFSLAQSLGEAAAISRLAYQALTSAGAESEGAALRFTRSRKLSLLGATFLQSLILGGVYLILAFVIGVLVVIFLAASGLGTLILDSNSDASFNPLAFFLLGLLVLLAFVAALVLYLWFAARLFLIEQPLAIETTSGATKAIDRSWQLTRTHAAKVIGVILVATLMTLPIGILVYGVNNALSQALLGPPPSNPEEIKLFPFLARVLLNNLVGLVGAIFTLPLLKAVFSTLYFDLRGRFEQALSPAVVHDKQP